MAYRNYRSYRKPQVHTITVKYAGECACCGGIINPGQIADYYPVGTIAGINKPMIAHLQAMNGNSKACSAELKSKQADKGLNDYAGDGLDSRYEDDCKDACGL
jgi:hypothetical protein